MQTTIKHGTALDYRINNEEQVRTVSFYGEAHAADAQAYLREHGIQDKVILNKQGKEVIHHDGKGNFHQFRPVFRQV